MPRPRRHVVAGLAGLALMLALAACGRSPVPEPAAATVLRCDANASEASYREASRRLIRDAQRAGRFDGTMIVAYDEPGPAARIGGALLRRAPDVAARVRGDHGIPPGRSLGPGRERVRVRSAEAAERLLDDARVRYAHPPVPLVPHGVPSDQHYDLQWNLSGFGIERAWDVEQGSDAVTVAIVDAGIDVTHPEFVGRIEDGWDFYDGDADVSSAGSHGTHVAGIAAATTGNGLGIAGVAGTGVRILPIKVFADDPARSDQRTVEAVAAAIRWAAGLPAHADAAPAARERPVRVINLSLGTDRSYDTVPLLDDAIRDARRQGVVVVASVGNDGTDQGITSPANGPCALAVASVDESLEPSAFSNYASEVRSVDLAAPGGFSAEGGGIHSTTNGGGYGSMSGTSMAAPFVSGAVALLASAHPEWDDVRILQQLLRTAHLPDETPPDRLGFGIACVDAALGAATRCGR